MKDKKTIYQIFFLIIFLILVFLVIRRHYIIKDLNSYNTKIEKRDSTEIENYKIQVYRNLELGNIIAYPNNNIFDRILLDEFAYKKYGVYLCHTLILDEDKEKVAKSIMDSVIFEKYGQNFYIKLLQEFDKIENTIPQNKTIDGYYLTVKQDYDDIAITRKYILNQLKERKLIPLNQNPFYPRVLRINFIVSKKGLIKNPQVLLKYNQKIDSTVVILLKELPFKWTPGTIEGKIVEFQQQIVFEFGVDPFYRKVD